MNRNETKHDPEYAPARTADRGPGFLLAALLLVASLGSIGGVAVARWHARRTAEPPPRQLVDFTLTDRTGRQVRRVDLTNQFLVVNCVFTSCSLSCLAVNDRMREIQELTADASDVRLVSVSVDPRTDTPAALAQFADRYGADTNRWLFLTGDKPELYRLIESSLVSRRPELASIIPGGFADTDRIMLLDRQGRLRESFNGLRRTTPREVVEAIARWRARENM